MKFLFCFITLFCLKQTSVADLNAAPLIACPTADQCATPAMRTSLKIQYGRGMIHEYKGQIDTVSGLDSFVVYIQGDYTHGCIAFKDLIVYRDNSLILSWIGFFPSPVFNLMGLVGHYKICCSWQSPSFNYMPYSWEFDLILKPVEVDSTKQETVLLVIAAINPEFLLYPNPAENTICFLNESEQIQTIYIWNMSGQKVAFYETNNTKADLPINNLPPGIYFLQAATASEKVIIKKFIKQ